MRCPHCGEVIDERALRPVSRPGQGTMMFAGICFLLSAAWELVSVTSAVPLFGAVRGGLTAGAYHVLWAGVMGCTGLGLVRMSSWTPRVVYGATLLYTIDRAIYLLDEKVRRAEIDQAIGSMREVREYLDVHSLMSIATSVILAVVACWWGFALYVRIRRDSFVARPESLTSPPGGG